VISRYQKEYGPESDGRITRSPSVSDTHGVVDGVPVDAALKSAKENKKRGLFSGGYSERRRD